MALFWFLLALVLLVAALVILRLDARQRGGGSRGQRLAPGRGSVRASGGAPEGDIAHAEGSGVVDDDEGRHPAPPAGETDASAESAASTRQPMLAPFQRTDIDSVSGASTAAQHSDADADADADAEDAEVAEDPDIALSHAETDSVAGAAAGLGVGTQTETDAEAHADTEALVATTAAAPDAATASDVYPNQPSQGASGAAPRDLSEPAVESPPRDSSEPAVESPPRLLDRVRALLPARRASGRADGRAVEPVEPEPVDPLAGSPVVRWLEDREFAPTPTPAPEFRHGDFAGGLSALGTVSHGAFRGRRAIMGVTGGRTVLALRRDTSSDVVLDLGRPDVDAEPGFHDAGQVGVLEARTSDYGRLDLIDRDRLTESVRDVPASVRRIWAEGEWVAATIDGVDDPGGWDDVVMALHGAADVLAPFPPIGGRARALPAEIDPGAPASAEGPQADPTMGMDGEVGTGTHGIAPLPAPADHVVVDTPTAPDAGAADDGIISGTAPTSTSPVSGADSSGAASSGEAGRAGSPPKRAGHLRLVPDRSAARDLSDVPVKADRGDAPDAAETQDAPDVTDGASTAPDAAAEEPVVEESDPFAEIMQPSEPVKSRGDVAADHLEPRPPLSRPTRGAGQAYPGDAMVPPLAAGAATGGVGIKPLGSEDDEDEIRDEVERFDAARIDGGSDFDESGSGRHGSAGHGSGGRHGADDLDPSEVTQKLSVAELAERMGVDPAEMRSAGRRRAKVDPAAEVKTDSGSDGGAAGERAQGRERPGIEPDVERTARIQLPPDIKD